MSLPVSAYDIVPLSSVSLEVTSRYINTAREFSNAGFGYDVIDYNISQNSFNMLISAVPLQVLANTVKNVSGINIGHTGNITFNTLKTDASLAPQSYIPLSSNYILSLPVGNISAYNIIPLKTTMGVTGEYDIKSVNDRVPVRVYDGIYIDGTGTMYSQFISNVTPVIFPPDSYTSVHIPYTVGVHYISALGFQNNGAIYGDSPINSDVILLDKTGYSSYTDSSNNTPLYGGQPLCIWLDSTGWKTRWWDSNNISQGAALSAPRNTSVFQSYIDIPSDDYVQSRDKFTYLSYGPDRNSTYVNSFSSNLVCLLSTWNATMHDAVNAIPAFIPQGVYDGSPDELQLNGDTIVQIPANSTMFVEDNLSVNLDVKLTDWSKGIATQLFGDFDNDGGYGLFYNNGNDYDMISIPANNGILYGLNYRGFKVFEKNIATAIGASAVKLDYICNDLYGEKWLYDSLNSKVHRLDGDNLIKFSISIPSTAVISKMAVNSQSELFILDTYNKRIRRYDVNGNIVSSSVATYTNFDITRADALKTANADYMTVNNNGDIIKILGINLYENTTVKYHIGQKCSSLALDIEGNIWITYSNRLIKLSPEYKKVFDIPIYLPFTDTSSVATTFVKELRNNIEYNSFWIIYNNNTYLIKIDKDGNILKRINLRDVINLAGCSALGLSIKGDFTGYDIKRKYNVFSNGAAISISNPAITLKLITSCAGSKTIRQLHTPCKDFYGWKNIGFTYNTTNGRTTIDLYIDGASKTSMSLTRHYKIDYGAKTSPFIIGGVSGKLESRNSESLYLNDAYMVGTVNNLRVYSTALSRLQHLALYKAGYYDNWMDMIWYCPTPPRTYLEEMKYYHVNRYHGHKSNLFNIIIRGLGVTSDADKDIIRNRILQDIDKLIPVNTEVNEIIFA